jgi:hypothetical protein
VFKYKTQNTKYEKISNTKSQKRTDAVTSDQLSVTSALKGSSAEAFAKVEASSIPNQGESGPVTDSYLPVCPMASFEFGILYFFVF